jgi:mRNA-degrading endonuclease toxin of MazEF toxin-antitoxin module
VALIVTPRYKRGQLVRISPKESERLSVPKDRPWLVLQNNDLMDSPDVLVCYLTGQHKDDGRLKEPRTTDIPIAKGTDLSKGKGEVSIRKDSYIRCSQIYSAKANSIEYMGTLPPGFMIWVDKMLPHCLGIRKLPGDFGFNPEETATKSKPQIKKKVWVGRNPGPIKKLPSHRKKRKNK